MKIYFSILMIYYIIYYVNKKIDRTIEVNLLGILISLITLIVPLSLMLNYIHSNIITLSAVTSIFMIFTHYRILKAYHHLTIINFIPLIREMNIKSIVKLYIRELIQKTKAKYIGVNIFLLAILHILLYADQNLILNCMILIILIFNWRIIKPDPNEKVST